MLSSSNALLIELNKIYRQKEESFVELLNKVRNNNMGEQDLKTCTAVLIPDSGIE